MTRHQKAWATRRENERARKKKLSDAAKKGHEECVRVLHTLGADLNKCDDSGKSPLYRAANDNKLASVRILVQLGTNVQPLLNADPAVLEEKDLEDSEEI